MQRLFKNIGLLTISQVANYLIPLITIPYITRVIGVDNYGWVEFGTVAMLYFSAIVIYGFNTTGTRSIAEHPNDMTLVSKDFSRIVSTRMFLLILTSIAFLVCMFTISKFEEQRTLMWFSFPIVIGWALYPEFLFQGLQKLQIIALANFILKALAAVMIFVLIDSPEDYPLVLAINASAQILVGLATLTYSLRKVDGLKWIWVKWTDIIQSLRNGAFVFLSHFFTRVSTFGSVIFLGFMLTEKELGLFAAAMKLITVSQSFILLPLFGALFPHLANVFTTDKKVFIKHFNQFLGGTLLVTLCSSVILYCFPEFFLQLVFGIEYINAAPLLQIMSPILMTSTLGYFSLNQGLLVLKKDFSFLIIVVSFGVLSMGLYYWLIPIFRANGAAWIKLLIDAGLALTGWVVFKNYMKRAIRSD